ncbi:MAG: ABC transporter ATP-binding protein, partial [Gemmatimonadetes bacterium]|nr:ABC transporter ATP-binding protein [Gemmatimonadota bacterium]
CGVAAFARRPLGTLSGGEQQRVRIARALAQQPRTLALDEPTAALDMAYEMAIFELLRELRSCGVAVLVITHNLNLAARYADELVLMDRGRVAAQGAPREVLTESLVEEVYGWPVEVTHLDAGEGAPQVVPLAGGAGTVPGARGSRTTDKQPH